MKLTKASSIALAAVLAVPLGISVSLAIASTPGVQPQRVPAHVSNTMQQNDAETNDAKGSDFEKPDADRAKEPKEAVDRDNVQRGPGNISDGKRETKDGHGTHKENND